MDRKTFIISLPFCYLPSSLLDRYREVEAKTLIYPLASHDARSTVLDSYKAQGRILASKGHGRSFLKKLNKPFFFSAWLGCGGCAEAARCAAPA